MPSAKSEAVKSVENLLTAMEEARKAIRATEVMIRRALRKVDSGTDVATALAIVQPAISRNLVNEALDAVEKSRHEVRRAVFAAGLEEGMTIGSLGRSWGFSRQLAARYAKEARGEI
ncbi:MAG: hypothetical protein ACLQPH_13075 [Acidimicrobiales bacterium]